MLVMKNRFMLRELNSLQVLMKLDVALGWASGSCSGDFTEALQNKKGLNDSKKYQNQNMKLFISRS